jgi:hypothetical protein
VDDADRPMTDEDADRIRRNARLLRPATTVLALLLSLLAYYGNGVPFGACVVFFISSAAGFWWYVSRIVERIIREDQH